MNQGFCLLCHREFISSAYYCCNKDELVCILCNDKECKNCGKRRKTQIQRTFCFGCTRRVDQRHAFFQFRNQKDYCSKCVQKAYEKNGSNPDKFYIHETSFEKYESDKAEVQQYLKSLCWCCLGKLTIAEQKQNQGKQIQKIRCQKCKHKSAKQESPKKTTFSTSSSTSYRKCDACGFSIYQNSGFITQDFAICQSCARLSSFQEEKMISSKIQPQIQQDDEWTRKDDEYWRSVKRQEIEMVENEPQQAQKPSEIKFTKIEENNFKSNKQIKKDNNQFQLHQSMKLDIGEEDSKTLQCTECSYEISQEDLVQDVCRCCYITRKDEEKKKQKSKIYENIFGVKKDEENKENELKYEKEKKCKICSARFALFEEEGGICSGCKLRSEMKLTSETYW